MHMPNIQDHVNLSHICIGNTNDTALSPLLKGFNDCWLRCSVRKQTFWIWLDPIIIYRDIYDIDFIT